MDKLIEAVAKAIWVANIYPARGEQPDESSMNDYRLMAKSAIAAVRAHDAGTDEGLRKPTHIGNLRRYLFAPFDCKWNGIVRDVTAKHEHDGECDAYAVFKKLVRIVRDNGQLDHSFPARMRLEEMFDVPPYGDEEMYVAWLRWAGDENHHHLVVCDSDDERAFKVYRCPTSPASHAAESAPPLISEGCAYHGASSRICERGTGGCEIHHAAESASTAPLNAADQSARNAGCNCSRKIPYLDFSHEKTCPLYSWTCGSSTAQLDAEDQHPKMRAEPVEDVVSRMCKAFKCSEEIWRQEMTAAFAIAREGYYSQQDVEKAIREMLPHWEAPAIDAFMDTLHKTLAPKPEPTLAEEIDKILLKHNIRTVTSENVVCNSAVSAELAALVERRAGK